MLTRGEQTRRSSVEYMLGTLIYDNMETMDWIVDQEVADYEVKSMLKKQIAAVVEYLKFYYAGNVESSADCFHNTDFALPSGDGGKDASPVSTCDHCLIPFQVLDDIREAAGVGNAPGADKVEGAKDRLKLCMGHIHGAVNQVRHIADVMESIRCGEAGHTVLS